VELTALQASPGWVAARTGPPRAARAAREAAAAHAPSAARGTVAVDAVDAIDGVGVTDEDGVTDEVGARSVLPGVPASAGRRLLSGTVPCTAPARPGSLTPLLRVHCRNGT
jgi:hypothetical protein